MPSASYMAPRHPLESVALEAVKHVELTLRIHGSAKRMEMVDTSKTKRPKTDAAGDDQDRRALESLRHGARSQLRNSSTRRAWPSTPCILRSIGNSSMTRAPSGRCDSSIRLPMAPPFQDSPARNFTRKSPALSSTRSPNRRIAPRREEIGRTGCVAMVAMRPPHRQRPRRRRRGTPNPVPQAVAVPVVTLVLPTRRWPARRVAVRGPASSTRFLVAVEEVLPLTQGRASSCASLLNNIDCQQDVQAVTVP